MAHGDSGENTGRTAAAGDRPIGRLYLSIVGHQLMATLNPLLALLKTGGLTRVVLFVTTGKSADLGEALLAFLRDNKVRCEMEIHPISPSLSATDTGLPPAQQLATTIVQRYEDAEVFFNLAGGMNFQISACALALEGHPRVRYLYPDFHAVRLYGVDSAGMFGLRQELDVDEMRVDQLLALQGVPFSAGSQAPDSSLLDQLLRKIGIALPANHQLNVAVAGVAFDAIFNRANTLYLCKVMPTRQGPKRLSLEMVRDFIGSVSNRRDFGELFHYQLLVLTNSPWAAERLETESGGKAAVLPYHSTMSPGASGFLRKKLKDFFRPQPRRNFRGGPSCPHRSSAPGERVLYTCIGSNIVPTLKAIWSHGTARSCLFYTPGDKQIEFFRRRLEQQRERLPSKIEFHAVSFHAEELEGFTPSQPFEVNITPGTKEQAFFLARMASKHGGHVFSINQDRLSALTGEADRAVRSPDIPTRIDLSIDSPTIRARRLQGSGRAKALLHLLQGIQQEEGNAIARFFLTGEQRFGHVHFQRQEDQFTVRYLHHEREICRSFSTKPNSWFEELVGHVVGVCGIDEPEVRLGLKINWKRSFHHNGIDQAFRTECDVFVQSGANAYLISCKAGSKISPAQSAREIKSTAQALDRMTIPLLAMLRYDGQPKLVEGVYLFGYRTLADFGAMKNLLELAARERSTTARP